jgi:hypothetical protein
MPLLRALGLLGSDAVSMHRGIQSSRTDEDSGAAVGQHREAGGGGPKGFRREPSDAAGVQVPSEFVAPTDATESRGTEQSQHIVTLPRFPAPGGLRHWTSLTPVR